MVRKLQYDPAAEKELSKLDRAVQRSVKKFLAELCELNLTALPSAVSTTKPPRLGGFRSSTWCRC